MVARKEERNPKKLLESNYLLGVFDEHRMGALRFKLAEDEPFFNDDIGMAVPPWTMLRELETASMNFELEQTDNPDYVKWINLLLALGSSLGGARPKVSVIDPKQHLWIAKFPSINDGNNIGAWEKVVNILVANAGIQFAVGELKRFNHKYHTYLTKRFDRNENGKRIHFASAITLLGYIDGAGFDGGVNYLQLAEFIMMHGANSNLDLEELWQRIVFFICIKNTDDHLRNHGFLLGKDGWSLSPAYDMNPNEYGVGLSLNISETDNALSLDLAMNVAKYFRVKEKKAQEIIEKVKQSVSGWKAIAENIGISNTEMNIMQTAFTIGSA